MPVDSIARRENLLAFVRARLPEEKVNHCISAADFAASFAPALGVDMDALITAVLLHDVCRHLSGEEMLERAERMGLPIGDLERRKPVLLHGPLAAEECRRDLHISEDIYEAIYWHTTGHPGLSPLGQAVYVADFAEPLRRYPEAAATRAILDRDGFDAALRYVARARFEFSLAKTAASPMSREFFEWLGRESK